MAMRRTKIGWADYSGADLGFIIGCTPKSEGCTNCYGFRWAERAGRDFSQVTIYWQKLNRLWKAKWGLGDVPYRRGPGSKPIMFPVDLGDLFHPGVPSVLIQEALDIFTFRADADWVLLTKRPQRMLDETEHWRNNKAPGFEYEWLPPNIWCLVTAENQRRADERIPVLLQVKAQVLGVSLEPMLEPMNLRKAWLCPYDVDHPGCLNWIICGAESGPRRRLFEVTWALDIYEECRIANRPFFGKQDSGLHPGIPLVLPGYGEVWEWP